VKRRDAAGQRDRVALGTAMKSAKVPATNSLKMCQRIKCLVVAPLVAAQDG
jgi:hypothetical protein